MPMPAVLLDTHALIWWAGEPEALSLAVRRLLGNEETKVHVSAASAWEIATKVRLRKLEWPRDETVESYCIGQGFALLPVTFAHAAHAGAWLHAHGDPFDRMLAAQGHIEQLPIATNDEQIAAFGVETVW